MAFDGAERLIENRIREAIEAGAFRNLRGAGRPLSLDGPDTMARDQWLGNHLLKNNNAVPAWIELAKEIDAAEDRAAALLDEYEVWLVRTARSLDAASPAEVIARRGGVRAIYDRYLARYAALLGELQAMKQRFNYLVPVRSLEKGWPSQERMLERLRERLIDQLGSYLGEPPPPVVVPPLPAARPALPERRPLLPAAPRARRRFLRRLREVAELLAAAR